MISVKTWLERVSNLSIGYYFGGGRALGLGGIDFIPDLFHVAF